jgi:hypothetical protein
MTERRMQFQHDGHRFDAVERVTGPSAASGAGEPQVRWDVSMDGKPVLEFRGEYPYRDDDVRKRILEWYGIQKPVPGTR